jgi:hypothetical protein
MTDLNETLIAREILGIDPGIGGGIAKWTPDKVEAWKMPKTFEDLLDFFDYQKEICKLPVICIEKVQMWIGDSEGGKQFRIQKMLHQYAELLSAIKVRKFPYIEIAPATWQKELKIRMKDETRQVRKSRFKDIAQDHYKQLRVNLNTSDAILIMHFMRHKIIYDRLWVISEIRVKEVRKNPFSI